MNEDKKDLNKKFDQKMALDKVIKQSFKYQQEQKDQRNAETINNMIKWNHDNLSPNGGKKPFVRTQPTQPKPRRHTKWLTKDE